MIHTAKDIHTFKDEFTSIHKKNRKGLLVTFKLYAARKTTLYFQVHIWKTKKDYTAHTGYKDSPGSCSRYEILNFEKGHQKKLAILGEVNLTRRRLTTEILSHELCHAAFGYCERKKFDVTDTHNDNPHARAMGRDSGEEQFCYSQGYMLRCLVNKLHKLKLLPQ